MPHRRIISENNRRMDDSSTSEILSLKSQYKALSDNNNALAQAIAQLRTDVQEANRDMRSDFQAAMKETRDLIRQKDAAHKPNPALWWSVVCGGIIFLAGWMTIVVDPIKHDIAALYTKVNSHSGDGHPHVVLAEFRAQGKIMQTELAAQRSIMENRFNALEKTIKRIDEYGSVVHTGAEAVYRKLKDKEEK